MDAQRNRASLGELRQVAEAAFENCQITVRVETTNCLGVCKPGHVMGFSHPREGVYIFNEMDSPEAVKVLVETFLNGQEKGTFELPYSLQEKLEGTLPHEAVNDIPWG